MVTGIKASLVPILKESETLGIDIDKVVIDRTVCVPNFTLEKYNKLRHSQLSILSMNCWGVITYNTLGLPFLSPTINMVTGNEEQFIQFLKNPIENMEKEFKYQRSYYSQEDKINHPIFNLGEVEWRLIHDDAKNLENILQNWYKRRYRINWCNSLFVMNTKDPELLKKFDRMPLAKKACFVPFETDIESAFYMNPKRYGTDQFNNSVLCFARETPYCYDIWDLLLYGKKTPLINQK